MRVPTLCLIVALAWILPGSASTRVEALLQQAEAQRSANPARFQALLKQVEALDAEATPAQREELAYLKAYSNTFLGRYDQAIREAKALLASSSSAEMRFRTGAFLINTYALTGRLTEGLRQLGSTMALSEQVHDPELREHGLIVAAALYNQIGQYSLGLQSADRVLASTTAERTRCFGGQYRLEALQNLGRLPPEDAGITRFIEGCLAQNERVVANFMRVTLARKWAQAGKQQQALDFVQKYLPEIEQTHYPRLIGDAHALLAELLLSAGQVDQAEAQALAAAALDGSINGTQPIVSAYQSLFRIAQFRHDPVAALGYYKKYAAADKAYLTVVKARELAYQIVRQESLEKSQQIELLNRQNRLLQLQQQVDRQAAENSRLVMLLVMVVALMIGYWAYKTRRLHVSLRKLAETDALTGVGNRHHFTRRVERALVECAKAGEPVALVMFDLDYFKAINDTYGHSTGDWVLKEVARTCVEFCRSVDQLGRLGGEEFAVLLHGCDLKAALRVAEDCRVRIARIATQPSGHAFPVTASFGVSTTEQSGYDIDRLLSHADQALYRAKRQGRNRTCVYTPDNPLQLPSQVSHGDATPNWHGVTDPDLPLKTAS